MGGRERAEAKGGVTWTHYVDMGNGLVIHEAFERISRVALRRCRHRLDGSPNSVRANVAMAQLGSTARSTQNGTPHAWIAWRGRDEPV